MSSVLEHILEKQNNRHKYFLAGKRLNRVFDGIKKHDYVLITGVSSSGKRSFVDNYYVIGLLRQWHALSAEERTLRPLKIVYFSTKYSEEFKLMKWSAHRYTTSTSSIMDIPTMTRSSGRIFNIDEGRKKRLYTESQIFEDAADAGVLEIIDGKVTSESIEKKMTSVLNDLGDMEYDDDGKLTFSPNEEFEKSLIVLIVDDLNHVKGGKSTFGSGNMEKDEINISVDLVLSKFAKLGVSVVAVKKTAYGNYGKYLPSVKESNGLSPNKCIVMFNPAQERILKHGNFETMKYIDTHGIQRLRFAFIAYNENGVSNMYLPLLFMPENGIFAELNSLDTEEANDYNEDMFNKYCKIRERK